MYTNGSRVGANSTAIPASTSTDPTSGINFHAQRSGMPTTAK
jgi:hypothetical protein